MIFLFLYSFRFWFQSKKTLWWSSLIAVKSIYIYILIIIIIIINMIYLLFLIIWQYQVQQCFVNVLSVYWQPATIETQIKILELVPCTLVSMS